MAYAEDTSVPVSKSKADVERVLAKAGADQFLMGYDQAHCSAAIMFRLHGRQMRLTIPIPSWESVEAEFTPTKMRRSTAARKQWADKEERRRWRALHLVVKAKIEAVESGVVTFEQEWGMHVLLPNGQTVGEWVSPQVDVAYESGRMPELAPWSRGMIEA